MRGKARLPEAVSRSRGSPQAEAKNKRPRAKPQANSMVAQARARPTVAPSLGSASGAASSSRHEVLDDAAEAEGYEEPA